MLRPVRAVLYMTTTCIVLKSENNVKQYASVRLHLQGLISTIGQVETFWFILLPNVNLRNVLLMQKIL